MALPESRLLVSHACVNNIRCAWHRLKRRCRQVEHSLLFAEAGSNCSFRKVLSLSSRVQVTWSATSLGLVSAELFAQASSLRGEGKLFLGHLNETSSVPGIIRNHHSQHLLLRALFGLLIWLDRLDCQWIGLLLLIFLLPLMLI